jgi:hypothetical protein
MARVMAQADCNLCNDKDTTMSLARSQRRENMREVRQTCGSVGCDGGGRALKLAPENVPTSVLP